MQTETSIAEQPTVAVAAEPTLLDQIVERQQEVASRYMPAMSIKQAIQRAEEIDEFIRRILKEGVDFGAIPGASDKPVLLKPGAEKLCTLFGYVPHYSVVEIEDWSGAKFGEPLFYYRYVCELRKDGKPVGQGEGSCNSWEKKYRYRNASRTCPQCGAASIIVGKPEYGGGFVCFAKKGGCGAKFGANDPAITGQQVGQVANPDFADVINTCQKMGQKRAYIAATLSATGASQWFTQDLEDIGEPSVPQIQQQAAKVDTGGAPVGTQKAADNVAQRKIAEAKHQLPINKFPEIMKRFEEIKSVIGDAAYYGVLANMQPPVEHANQLGSQKRFQEAFDAMVAIASEGVPQ